MYNFTQKELLEEGFWDSLKNSKIGRIGKRFGQGGLEVLKAVAPKTSSQFGGMVQGTRDAFSRIGKAGRKMEDRILEWLDERGLMPLPENPEIKKIRSFADGNSQWRVEVGKKSVNQNGEPYVSLKYTYPTAIVLHNKKDDTFKFVLQPDNRRVKRVA